MFAYELTAAGPDNLRRTERERPDPGPTEVEIRIEACSLNYHDMAVLNGLMPGQGYPRVPLSDGCGIVERRGALVTHIDVGARVLPLFYPLWIAGRPTPVGKREILGETVDGCLREYVCLDAESVVTAPTHLGAAQAATLPCAALTAWQALMDGDLEPGSTIVVQGTGGVAVFALQFARALGFTVIATSSSDAKLEQARSLGAHHIINYREHPDWHRAVLDITAGMGADAVIDVGGETTLPQSVKAVRMDGHIAVIGVLGGFGDCRLPVAALMQKNISLKGVTVGNRDTFMLMNRFMELHGIHPCISHRIPADELQRGLELMLAGEHFGKIGVHF